jgi:hypothetical protein
VTNDIKQVIEYYNDELESYDEIVKHIARQNKHSPLPATLLYPDLDGDIDIGSESFCDGFRIQVTKSYLYDRAPFEAMIKAHGNDYN